MLPSTRFGWPKTTTNEKYHGRDCSSLLSPLVLLGNRSFFDSSRFACLATLLLKTIDCRVEGSHNFTSREDLCCQRVPSLSIEEEMACRLCSIRSENNCSQSQWRRRLAFRHFPWRKNDDDRFEAFPPTEQRICQATVCWWNAARSSWLRDSSHLCERVVFLSLTSTNLQSTEQDENICRI